MNRPAITLVIAKVALGASLALGFAAMPHALAHTDTIAGYDAYAAGRATTTATASSEGESGWSCVDDRNKVCGPNNPQGFVLTAVLGIAGAFVSTWIGQSIGWYRPDQGAGLIAATLGAVIVLVIWHRLVVQRTVNDPGVPHTNWPPRA